ncbi:RNA chaperone ProQ [Rodentibacter caecimuris]|uniref:RNA chaperone ProQ n=1 Tax=Rodentibacter caecimuris TaxID=1796644 RepID=A0ABX3KVZ6_9PAST|nr:RNA chaperone ProQ [Rodentibacter heylii]
MEQEAKGLSTTQKFINNKVIIEYLAEKFPRCFILEGEAKPLKIGLFQDLAEILKDDEKASKTQLRHALRQYTSNWRYLAVCREGAERVDLEGNVSGFVDAEHAAHAAQQLAESKARFHEKRKAMLAEKKAHRKQPNKPHNKFKKPKFHGIDLSTLSEGANVKVKVGNRAKNAIVLQVLKDSARVELDNGLVINVTADRLVN